MEGYTLPVPRFQKNIPFSLSTTPVLLFLYPPHKSNCLRPNPLTNSFLSNLKTSSASLIRYPPPGLIWGSFSPSGFIRIFDRKAMSRSHPSSGK